MHKGVKNFITSDAHPNNAFRCIIIIINLFTYTRARAHTHTFNRRKQLFFTLPSDPYRKVGSAADFHVVRSDPSDVCI